MSASQEVKDDKGKDNVEDEVKGSPKKRKADDDGENSPAKRAKIADERAKAAADMIHEVIKTLTAERDAADQLLKALKAEHNALTGQSEFADVGAIGAAVDAADAKLAKAWIDTIKRIIKLNHADYDGDTRTFAIGARSVWNTLNPDHIDRDLVASKELAEFEFNENVVKLIKHHFSKPSPHHKIVLDASGGRNYVEVKLIGALPPDSFSF